MPGLRCLPRRLPPPQQTKQAGGRICLDRAHLAHTETVIRQALGRSRGSEEAVGKEGRGAEEWGGGREGAERGEHGVQCATLIQGHSKTRAD